MEYKYDIGQNVYVKHGPFKRGTVADRYIISHYALEVGKNYSVNFKILKKEACRGTLADHSIKEINNFLKIGDCVWLYNYYYEIVGETNKHYILQHYYHENDLRSVLK